MWNKVLSLLEENESIGTSFNLCCPRHMDTNLQASTPENFAVVSPGGGCRLTCHEPLPDCGHACQATCHNEAMHQSFSCSTPCERVHNFCGHPCQKTCGEKCGDCTVKINGVKLSCGHLNDGIPCYKTDPLLLENLPCKAIVEEEIPSCGHKVDRKCHEKIDHDIFKCSHPCEETLPCGCPCTGKCGTYKQKVKDGGIIVKHSACQNLCNRAFANCNHRCRNRCHGDSDCGTCPSKCQVRSMTRATARKSNTLIG